MTKVTRKTCPVCNHEERDIIEQGVLDGSIDPSVLDKDNGWWNGKLHGYQSKALQKLLEDGKIDRSAWYSVKDEMKQSNLPFICQDSSVQDVLVIMTEGRLGLALVGTKENLNGVITDGDIRRALIDKSNFSELKAADLMNKNPLTALETDNLQLAENRMREAKVQCLIVKNKINDVVGVIQIFE